MSDSICLLFSFLFLQTIFLPHVVSPDSHQWARQTASGTHSSSTQRHVSDTKWNSHPSTQEQRKHRKNRPSEIIVSVQTPHTLRQAAFPATQPITATVSSSSTRHSMLPGWLTDGRSPALFSVSEELQRRLQYRRQGSTPIPLPSNQTRQRCPAAQNRLKIYDQDLR